MGSGRHLRADGNCQAGQGSSWKQVRIIIATRKLLRTICVIKKDGLQSTALEAITERRPSVIGRECAKIERN
ncbi:MAG TPA: hypothetical protein VFI72_13490 [Candidatus Angelobacter sp.]|nr:hypothetical protein [Candidatus Angelobacter sp.]